MVTVDLSTPQTLTFAIGTVAPVLVGLVTTKITQPGTKAVLLLAISVLTGLGSELLEALNNNETYDLGTGSLLALTTFITGVATHYGLWKPTGVSEKAANSLITAKTKKKK